ncbi:MAG: sugar ABC transporter permease [Spirochaetaceae bacterium]|nr:sugar ABC transporter permease [Spirochaetaceae bacterium]
MTARLSASRVATAYLYIAPFFVLFIVFGLFPILYSLALSFTYWKGGGAPVFVFLDNYIALFQDRSFFKALYNTLFIFVVGHAVMLPGAFLIAYVLTTEYVKRKNLFQAFFFTPIVTSTIAISLVFSMIFGERFGVVNYALSLIGAAPVEWYHGSGQWIKFVIIVLFVWKWYGWNAVIYFSGMQGIDRELYECAEMEGAGKWQILRFITAPLMRPVILYTLVMSFVGGLQLFDEPYIITAAGPTNFSGGTNQAGLTIAMYLYKCGFSFGQLGYASSIAYALMFIIVALSLLSFRFLNGRGERP